MTKRLLLIGGDEGYVSRMIDSLDITGADVRHVRTLAEAMTAQTSEPADAVIFDLGAADAHGMEAVQQLRREFHRLPIVVLSDRLDVDTAEEALRRGAQEFLVKDGYELNALVRALALASLRQRKQDFEQLVVGVVGHDLRQPLQTISVGTSLLSQEPSLSPHGRTTTERIARAVKQAETLVHDLLDLTRIQFVGQLPVDPEQLELASVVASVVKEMQSLYPDRRVDLNAPEPLHGLWDRGRIEQVLTNLLVNALQHSPVGSPVHVALEADDDCAYLSVHNEGPPIPLHILPHVFEPLAQADSGPAARVGSVGLGLFIADHIVRAHGGEIAVSSSEEAGTTFRVVLPRLLNAACELPPEPAAATAP